MRFFRFLQWWAATLACATWVLPAPRALGAAPGETYFAPHAAAAAPVVDIALGAGGRLVGQVVDGTGKPLARQTILVQPVGGSVSHRATSDAEGRFAVEGLTGGVFQVMAKDTCLVCRCWTHAAAPPVAKGQLLLVSGESLERGQRPIGEMLFSTPVLVALIIAAAIAIPIAIHNARDDSAS